MSRHAIFAVVAGCLLSVAFTQNSESEYHGIVVANMDRSVKPSDDFYRYANGGWIKRTEIPPDSGYVAIGGYSNADSSTELTRKQTAGLIEEAVKAKAPAGSNTRKIADFYLSFMDEATVEAKGIAPLRLHLDAITAICNKHDRFSDPRLRVTCHLHLRAGGLKVGARFSVLGSGGVEETGLAPRNQIFVVTRVIAYEAIGP